MSDKQSKPGLFTMQTTERAVYQHPADKDAGIPPLFKCKLIITDCQENVEISDFEILYRVKGKYD